MGRRVEQSVKHPDRARGTRGDLAVRAGANSGSGTPWSSAPLRRRPSGTAAAASSIIRATPSSRPQERSVDRFEALPSPRSPTQAPPSITATAASRTSASCSRRSPRSIRTARTCRRRRMVAELRGIGAGGRGFTLRGQPSSALLTDANDFSAATRRTAGQNRIGVPRATFREVSGFDEIARRMFTRAGDGARGVVGGDRTFLGIQTSAICSMVVNRGGQGALHRPATGWLGPAGEVRRRAQGAAAGTNYGRNERSAWNRTEAGGAGAAYLEQVGAGRRGRSSWPPVTSTSKRTSAWR